MKPNIKTFAIAAGLLVLVTVAIATAPVAAPIPPRQPPVVTHVGSTAWNHIYTLEYTDRQGRFHSCAISETKEFAFVPTSIACPN